MLWSLFRCGLLNNLGRFSGLRLSCRLRPVFNFRFLLGFLCFLFGFFLCLLVGLLLDLCLFLWALFCILGLWFLNLFFLLLGLSFWFLFFDLINWLFFRGGLSRVSKVEGHFLLRGSARLRTRLFNLLGSFSLPFLLQLCLLSLLCGLCLLTLSDFIFLAFSIKFEILLGLQNTFFKCDFLFFLLAFLIEELLFSAL